jgi:hypothetical protein
VHSNFFIEVQDELRFLIDHKNDFQRKKNSIGLPSDKNYSTDFFPLLDFSFLTFYTLREIKKILYESGKNIIFGGQKGANKLSEPKYGVRAPKSV